MLTVRVSYVILLDMDVLKTERLIQEVFGPVKTVRSYTI